MKFCKCGRPVEQCETNSSDPALRTQGATIRCQRRQIINLKKEVERLKETVNFEAGTNAMR